MVINSKHRGKLRRLRENKDWFLVQRKQLDRTDVVRITFIDLVIRYIDYRMTTIMSGRRKTRILKLAVYCFNVIVVIIISLLLYRVHKGSLL